MWSGSGVSSSFPCSHRERRSRRLNHWGDPRYERGRSQGRQGRRRWTRAERVRSSPGADRHSGSVGAHRRPQSSRGSAPRSPRFCTSRSSPSRIILAVLALSGLGIALLPDRLVVDPRRRDAVGDRDPARTPRLARSRGDGRGSRRCHPTLRARRLRDPGAAVRPARPRRRRAGAGRQRARGSRRPDDPPSERRPPALAAARRRRRGRRARHSARRARAGRHRASCSSSPASSHSWERATRGERFATASSPSP